MFIPKLTTFICIYILLPFYFPLLATLVPQIAGK